MATKLKNFRLSAAACEKLARLKVVTRSRSETAVVEDLIMAAGGGVILPPTAAPVDVAGGEATTGPDEFREGSVSVKRTLGGVKRVQVVPEPGWKK